MVGNLWCLVVIMEILILGSERGFEFMKDILVIFEIFVGFFEGLLDVVKREIRVGVIWVIFCFFF